MLINPKISIITCTNNSEKYLNEMILSVQNQTYQNIEHIFIDNQSNDGTLKIIKQYQQAHDNVILITEADQGIYDALNKGLALATGEIIGILHSDDVFADRQALARIASSFSQISNLDFYCSRMAIYDTELKKQFAVLGAPPHQQTCKEKLYSSTYYAHPTYYCTKKTIEQVGLYNLQYHLAADIDWLIRLEKLNLKYYFDKDPLIKFRSVGSSAKQYFKALWEEFIIRKKYTGCNLNLLLIYSYHFLRRGVRTLLRFCKLDFLISGLRKIIFGLAKR